MEFCVRMRDKLMQWSRKIEQRRHNIMAEWTARQRMLALWVTVVTILRYTTVQPRPFCANVVLLHSIASAYSLCLHNFYIMEQKGSILISC